MSVYSALLNNGPLQVGPVADRGAFDQYATYRPGNVVVDGGVVYLNVAAIGASPVLEDAFDRRDQQGWGQSSHGEVWQASPSYSNDKPPVIRSGRGVMDYGGAAYPDGQLLGPAAARGDAELLTRLLVLGPAVDTVVEVRLGLDVTEDGQNQAMVHLHVNPDQTSAATLILTRSGSDAGSSGSEAGPSLVSGVATWVRLRRVGLDYSAYVWPAGTPEPGTPVVTATASGAMAAGHPLVYPNSVDVGAAFAVEYLALRHLTVADAPADDTGHWVALADALQVPQPY